MESGRTLNQDWTVREAIEVRATERSNIKDG